MATLLTIHTNDAPAAIGPYAQAKVVSGGAWVFCSGQIPLKPDGTLVTGSIEDETEQVLSNCKAVLKAAGSSFAHVMKATIFLTNMDDFAKVNEVYGKHMGENPPARSTVAVAGLPKGVRVEIEMIAAVVD